MEEITPKKFILNAGLFTGLVSIVFSIMLYSLDAHYENGTASQVISVIIQISGIIWGAYEFKKANSGFISLSETLKIGTGVSLILALISIMYLYILTNIIEPGFYDISLEIAYNSAIENNPDSLGGMNLNEYMASAKPFVWLAYPVVLIFTLFLGFMESLLIGLVIKKEQH